MAKIIIRDNNEAATALAELIYSDTDKFLDAKNNFEDQDGNPDESTNNDLWAGQMELMATLVCNPTLFNCLSKYEVEDLVRRADERAQEYHLTSPNDFFFDF